jgi:hypothetical protein
VVLQDEGDGRRVLVTDFADEPRRGEPAANQWSEVYFGSLAVAQQRIARLDESLFDMRSSVPTFLAMVQLAVAGLWLR